MINPIVEQFKHTFILYEKKLNQNGKAYLYANDATSCLEVSTMKKMLLCDVFEKMRAYLQKNFRVSGATSEIKNQIKDLSNLLKEGRSLIRFHRRKNATLSRRLLKLVQFYIPKILKNYFPHLFNNTIETTEQRTKETYRQYCNCIEMLQNQLKNLHTKKEMLNLKIVQKKIIEKPKDINTLPDAVICKIFQEQLLTQDKVNVSKVCKHWNKQLKIIANRERLSIKASIESIIDSLDGKRFEFVAKQLKSLSEDKQIELFALALKDRVRVVQEKCYKILQQQRRLVGNHEEIVRMAVSFNGEAIRFASLELQSNAEILKIAVNQNAQVFKFISDKFKNDAEIAKIALNQDGGLLWFASGELKGNAEIVKIAVAQNGLALQFASAELQGNTEIVRIAVAQDGGAIRYPSLELQSNIEIVQIAVNQYGGALRYISAELKGNAEIVKIAVAQDGLVLQAASPELKDNVEVVKIAVAQNGLALQFASAGLKKNAEIVKIAFTQNERSLNYAPPELKDNLKSLSPLIKCL